MPSTALKRWIYYVLVLKSGEMAVWNKKGVGPGGMAQLALNNLVSRKTDLLGGFHDCRHAEPQLIKQADTNARWKV